MIFPLKCSDINTFTTILYHFLPHFRELFISKYIYSSELILLEKIKRSTVPTISLNIFEYFNEPIEIYELSDEDRKNIQKMVDEGNLIDWNQISDMDYCLHFTIIKYSINKRISTILSSYHSQIKRFQLLSAESLADVKNTIKQHVDLLECLRERDSKKFSTQLHEHIVKSEENILKDYFIK